MSPRSLRLRIESRALRALLAIHPSALLAVTGPPPVNDRGHSLDAALHVLLRIASARGTLSGERDVARERATFQHDARIPDFPRERVHRTEDRTIDVPGGRIAIRIYEPTERTSNPRPACVYTHGGGFVLGDLDTHDGVCRRIARRAGCVVISVDYRLAPEHKFPGPSRDGIAAFRWVAEHAAELGIDPARIAVAGDSAGANIAACTALSERDAKVRPRFQLLVYPVTDFTHATESYRLYRDGYLLTAESMAWFKRHHLTDPEREERDPRGSLVHATDVARVAPAYILTAGFDPLRDEGDRYAEKLRAARVPVELVCAESMIHGFFSMGGAVRSARRQIDRAIDALARALA